MAERKKRNAAKKRRIIIMETGGLAVFCILFSFIPSVTAKYIKQTEIKGVAIAREFYFSSNLLDGSMHQITAGEDGRASVSFVLMNYEEERKYSEVDIDYVVTVEEEDGDKENDVVISPAAGKIPKGMPDHVEIMVSGLTAEHTYRINASTDNTYTKTLTGTVKVGTEDEQMYLSTEDEDFTDSIFPETEQNEDAESEAEEDTAVVSDKFANDSEYMDFTDCEPAEETENIEIVKIP